MSDRKQRNTKLELYRRFKTRQSVVRFGPEYQPAIRAVKGEAPEISNPGELPAPQLGRNIQALSWPEKVCGALALYAGVFELHDQHVFYPRPIQHPLAYHPFYSSLAWPTTDGTLQIAHDLGVGKYHPMAWVPHGAAAEVSSSIVDNSGTEQGVWEIGAWIGDFLLYLNDAAGPYCVFWSVKQTSKDHGLPGGAPRRRLNSNEVEAVKARDLVCAAYAEQLGCRTVHVDIEHIDANLAATLVMLCRASNASAVHILSPEACADLVAAYQEAIGKDVLPRDIAKKIVAGDEHLTAAKELLYIAVWHRRLRVDLEQGVYWHRPLLPESTDLLAKYAHWFARLP